MSDREIQRVLAMTSYLRSKGFTYPAAQALAIIRLNYIAEPERFR